MHTHQLQVAVRPSADKEPEPEPCNLDPVPVVQELLNVLVAPEYPVEHKVLALQPLVAAAGLAEPPPGSTLHPGAVLFALTDPECASKVVGLVNHPDTDPLIKSWLLALVLSLVHPEKGLNPGTRKVGGGVGLNLDGL